MLHIIFLIIKILGMILLILLGILMLVLLSILVVPIRYQLFVNHGDDLLVVRGRINWLLHLIHASIIWEDESKLHITVRIFGFLFYDNLRVKKVIKTKNKKTKIKKRKKKKTLSKKKKQRIQKPKVMEEITKDDIALLNQLNDSIHINVEETPILNDKKFNQEKNEASNEGYKRISDQKDHGEKTSFLEKIFLRIKIIKDKVIEFFRRIKRRIIHIIDTFEKIMKKKELILNFYHNEMNKEGFKVTWSSLKKLIKHIMPTKLKSSVVFGTGDPCSTGQALGAVGIIYSFYGDKVKIIPDFENKRFDGTHEARGRLRAGTILIIVIKLIMDKRFKELKRNVKILKEAL